MTIRKNFLLDAKIVEHLEKIAKIESTTQTNVIRNMIEKKYEEINIQEKLVIIDKLAGSMNGLIGDDVSIQSIKMEMGSKI